MSKLTDNTEILTRREAAAVGRLKYWNGRRCRKGHDALRYTTTGACSECVRGYHFKVGDVRTARAATARGLVRVEAFAHPADHSTILAFVAAVTLAREFSGLSDEPEVLVYRPGAKTRDGADIVPDTPPISLADIRKAELLADLDRRAAAGGTHRPIDLANC